MAAVKTISFDVRVGEIVGIGGPNGAGKTSLFDVIAGLQPADEGAIFFNGEDVTSASPQELCHRGLARVFQSVVAFDSMTLRENVVIGAAYGHRLRFVPPLMLDRDTLERADRALDTVGLLDRANVPIASLPVLDRKLAMFASALATEPLMLLLDEPVGGLNPAEADRVMAVVRSLAEGGLTILLIEHVMRFMVQLCRRIIIMQHGEKIYEGSSEGMVRDPTVVSVYLGSATARRLFHFLAAS
jgi:branched-chain amino acid transport system ATP-binding protein